MGCYSSPGDERLEQKAEHYNANSPGAAQAWVKVYHQPPCLYYTLGCSFFRVVLALANDTQS